MKKSQLRFKRWSNLDATFRSRLKSLSFRKQGLMVDTLSYASKEAVVAYILEDNTILAWGIYFEKLNEIQLYTRKTYRGKGLAKKLAIRLLKHAKSKGRKRVNVYKHDHSSRKFWDKMKIPAMNVGMKIRNIGDYY